MWSSEKPWGWLYRLRTSRNFILFTVCLAIFNDLFLFGTIVPILPYALPDRINVDPDNVQMYISILLAAYAGALLAGSLVSGWVGDKMKRRHPLFLTGLSLLLAATLLLALGRSIGVLVVGRLLQGLAAAVVWTSSLGILADIFGKERYGEAVGWSHTGVSLGTTSAPLLGGVVYAKGGYNAVSFMSLGTVVVTLALGSLMIEPAKEYASAAAKQAAKIAAADMHVNTGYGTQNATTTEEVTTPNSDSDTDVDEYTTLIPRKVVDRTCGQLTYLTLLSSPRILAAMGGFFTYSFVMISMEGLIPLFVKETFYWDSTRAALTFLSWIIPGFLSPIAGWASDRFGSKWPAVTGLICAVPPLILLRLIKENTTEQKVLMCGLLSCVGLCFVWVQPSCLADLSVAANELQGKTADDDWQDAGSSSQSFGLFVFAFSLGSLVGPLVTGTLKTKMSFGSATLLLACVCVCTSIPILLKTSGASRRSKQSSTPAA